MTKLTSSHVLVSTVLPPSKHLIDSHYVFLTCANQTMSPSLIVADTPLHVDLVDGRYP